MSSLTTSNYAIGSNENIYGLISNIEENNNKYMFSSFPPDLPSFKKYAKATTISFYSENISLEKLPPPPTNQQQ